MSKTMQGAGEGPGGGERSEPEPGPSPARRLGRGGQRKLILASVPLGNLRASRWARRRSSAWGGRAANPRMGELPRHPGELETAGRIPRGRDAALDEGASAPEPTASHDVGALSDDRMPMDSIPHGAAPVAERALRRQTPEARAACGKPARADPCGGGHVNVASLPRLPLGKGKPKGRLDALAVGSVA